MKYLFQKRRKLYFAFIDFNNAFDGVERVTLNTALLRKAYVCSEGYLQIWQSMCHEWYHSLQNIISPIWLRQGWNLSPIFFICLIMSYVM